MSSLDLARAAYRAISLYAPDRSPAEVDLSDNTNLWGVPPAAERAIRDASVATVTRYPALYAGGLKAELAGYAGVREDEIVTGCGSDDVLDSAIRAFGEPGERIAFPDPSFPMVPIFGRMNGLEPVAVPLTDALDIDAEALLATGARIIYLCTPNNPTGTLASPAAVERVLKRAPGVVILDEAYAEFAGPGYLGSAPERPRVLVVRTMSKAFGLAGLRIGYAAGAAELVAEVEKSRGPYKVNALAERAAVAALSHDSSWVGERIAEAVANRERLAGALGAMGLVPIPSAANFVLVPVPGAVLVARRMRDAGVAIRPFSGLRGIGDAIRISVAPWPLLERCLGALHDALRDGRGDPRPESVAQKGRPDTPAAGRS